MILRYGSPQKIRSGNPAYEHLFETEPLVTTVWPPQWRDSLFVQGIVADKPAVDPEVIGFDDQRLREMIEGAFAQVPLPVDDLNRLCD